MALGPHTGWGMPQPCQSSGKLCLGGTGPISAPQLKLPGDSASAEDLQWSEGGQGGQGRELAGRPQAVIMTECPPPDVPHVHRPAVRGPLHWRPQALRPGGLLPDAGPATPHPAQDHPAHPVPGPGPGHGAWHRAQNGAGQRRSRLGGGRRRASPAARGRGPQQHHFSQGRQRVCLALASQTPQCAFCGPGRPGLHLSSGCELCPGPHIPPAGSPRGLLLASRCPWTLSSPALLHCRPRSSQHMPCPPVSTLTAGHCPWGAGPAVPQRLPHRALRPAGRPGLRCPHSVPPPCGALHPAPGVGSLSWSLAEGQGHRDALHVGAGDTEERVDIWGGAPRKP